MHNCTRTCVLSDKSDDFIVWLVQILGPVLVGSKPAEILSFPNWDKKLPNKIKKIEKYIGKCSRISYRIFKFNNNSVKILFYNPKTLDENLREHRNMKFLKNLEYPKQYCLESYVAYIIDKMKEGVIPHEIGVFLGYPLKDIIGFMGHPSLKLTKVNGWRVYGDPRLSDEKFQEISVAKEKIRNLLKLNRPEKILLSM